MEIYRTDITQVIEGFITKLKPEDRYSSFDYCYNYFRMSQPNDLTNDIEKSCLVLGFYLASWGMFRGSSFILNKSVKHFQSTIEYFSNLDSSIWEIDVDKYNEENIEKIIEVYSEVKSRIIKDGNMDLTLISKILLGVFGFIPAFDQYFCSTFRIIFKEQNCGFRRVNTQSLKHIKSFYDNNELAIDKLANSIFTTDFISGQKGINYPKAKIIDMYGFTARL